MGRVLIVTPHFPPVNAPDPHRVRMALPFFRDHGWEPVVLTVDPDFVEGVRDPFLEKTIPAGTRIIRTKAISVALTRFFGIRSLALRSMGALRQAGDALLRSEKFDLVFF